VPTVPEPPTGNYFVAAYPPFPCWSPRALAHVPEVLARAPNPVPLGLYVHVPFCVERCQYCYYLTHDDRAGARADYLVALRTELESLAREPLLADRPLDFVYVGGGTPSSLTAAQLERLLTILRRPFSWERVREVTVECAPRTLSAAKVEILRAAGVNRLSLGVQQLDDAVLALNGRVHGEADVARAWELLEGAGFETRNVDLMVGLIGETEAGFQRSLERVIDLGPESVTLYLLEIPHNTRLYRKLRDDPGGPAPAPWPEKRARLVRGFERLAAAGYVARSAYTAVRPPAPRTFVYQDEQYAGADLLGVGVSSFSYLAGAHVQNLARLDDYLVAVARGERPLQRAYLLDATERLTREFVLRLKLLRVPLDELRAKHGRELPEAWREPLERFEAAGWLECGPTVVDVTPAGVPFVDGMLDAFALPAHRACSS
jgi:oxygen-independent coproporphyrinogen-3 oxidase